MLFALLGLLSQQEVMYIDDDIPRLLMDCLSGVGIFCSR